MRTSPFIDIHTHPDFKTFLSANKEKKKLNCWENINLPLKFKIVNFALHNILESQSSLTQLNEAKGSIAVVGLCACEKAIITGDFPLVKGNGFDLLSISKRLKTKGQHYKIDSELLKRISSPKINYFKLFNKMQKHLLKSKNMGSGYKLLTRIGDHDARKLNIILTIEGGHNLCNKTFGSNKTKKVLSNLNKLKNGKKCYFFLSLAHLERNDLCTHAYGMKIVKSPDFNPAGKGITDLGKEVIKVALKKPNRILIDIKHMSLEARKQYYEILEKGNGLRKIPIIISHAGITGRSYSDMPVVSCKENADNIEVEYYQPDGDIKGTKFNPWSINLYDEEIATIIRSKGLIGLSLDERILGTMQKKRAERIEYFSKDELSCSRFDKIPPGYRDSPEPEEKLSEYEKLIYEFESKLQDYKQEICENPDEYPNLQDRYNELQKMHKKLLKMRVRKKILKVKFRNDIKHLCNNILHIVKIGGKDAWKQICIGSDFDGLINPIEGCRNATEYLHLSRALKRLLSKMTKLTRKNFYITNIDQQVDDIMYDNAYSFLSKNFR